MKAFPSLPPRVIEKHGQEQVYQFVCHSHKNTEFRRLVEAARALQL
jgi:hypothetical protein